MDGNKTQYHSQEMKNFFILKYLSYISGEEKSFIPLFISDFIEYESENIKFWEFKNYLKTEIYNGKIIEIIKKFNNFFLGYKPPRSKTKFALLLNPTDVDMSLIASETSDLKYVKIENIDDSMPDYSLIEISAHPEFKKICNENHINAFCFEKYLDHLFGSLIFLIARINKFKIREKTLNKNPEFNKDIIKIIKSDIDDCLKIMPHNIAELKKGIESYIITIDEKNWAFTEKIKNKVKEYNLKNKTENEILDFILKGANVLLDKSDKNFLKVKKRDFEKKLYKYMDDDTKNLRLIKDILKIIYEAGDQDD